MNPERVAIVGAEAHPDLSIVRRFVRALPGGTTVVSGAAAGVDTVARETALECGLAVIELGTELIELTGGGFHALVHRTTWTAKGTMANHVDVFVGRVEHARDVKLLRNTWVVTSCTWMAVFPDGSRGGSWDTAREGKRFHRPVEIRWLDGRVVQYSVNEDRQTALF